LKIRTYIITVSDKGARGEREDVTGPKLKDMLVQDVYEVVGHEILPDEYRLIVDKLCELADGGDVDLILTNGGTGFSPRDVTPEATLEVVDRRVPGIPEAMRQASLVITPMAVLSRSEAGIRKRTLIVNLPGSPKAATENLAAVIAALPHGIEVMRGEVGDCAEPVVNEPVVNEVANAVAEAALTADVAAAIKGVVVAVNVSERKGTTKKEVESILLRPDWGIEGDAHAGNWHRQVSLLAEESIDIMRAQTDMDLENGIFAENINTRGIDLKSLPIGTRLAVGSAILEVTQIGKECHDGGCAVMRAVGHCIMPREGIFAKTIQGGTVRAGDPIHII
jgi:molybdopterin adenylyltransferase